MDLQQSENLVLQAMFTAVPAPSFTWTFQSSKSVNVQQLVNGTDDVLIRNTFDTENISARSVVTRQNIEEDWFGMYKVTATNAFGTAVLRFTVREKRNPGIPTISLVACTQPNSAEISWSGGGDTQYYQVLFSDDRFLNSKEVYPSMIPSQADRKDGYSLTIENLVAGQAYFFKVTAYNSYGNTTSTEAVGCVVREENSFGTDGVFVTGVVLTVVGVISLLIGIGLVIFVTRNRLACCSPDQIPKQDKYQDIQLSDRDGARQNNTDRSPYQHT
ncbi:titin-like isoform X1 [Argopecten irradians]|uniref:titin-like isoform X1 n=1 Tax=Argopecten irradians TaxID=31199 RepID=UPI003717F5D9